MTTYRKSYNSIGTKMNDLDLWLAGHVNHCVTFDVESRKPLRDVWFQRTTNRIWPTGNLIVS